MRAVVQRVKKASVTVDNNIISQIDNGILLLLGIENSDTSVDVDYIVKKTLNLRIFNDKNEVMNESLLDKGYEILIVSQFTLYGDARKGNRPSYIQAAKFDEGIKLYEEFVEKVRKNGVEVKTGSYGADMEVLILNDGPVTILLDSNKNF